MTMVPGPIVSSRTEWNAAELLNTTFPDLKWAVPGLVPEGLSLLVGAPKVGKSYLALNLAVAVARGEKALGEIDCDSGDTLYLALEDSPRRLRTRLEDVLGTGPVPSRLTVITAEEWRGIDQVKVWLRHHPEARLVVIDILARVRDDQPEGNAYRNDYKALLPYLELARKYQVAIVVLHHDRKMKAEDWLEGVSGTNGLTGAADTILMLQRRRGADKGRLFITGRDVEEDERAAAFDPPNGGWSLLPGSVLEYNLTPERQLILQAVRDEPGLTPTQIAERTGISQATVKHLVRKMVNTVNGVNGLLTDDGRGHYSPFTQQGKGVQRSPFTQGCPGERGEQGEHPSTVNGERRVRKPKTIKRPAPISSLDAFRKERQ